MMSYNIPAKAMIFIAVIASHSVYAATVKGDTMACPSIDAWEHVMEKMKLDGPDAAIKMGRDGGCIRVMKDTSISVIDRTGPFSRVKAPNNTMYYFVSQDLR